MYQDLVDVVNRTSEEDSYDLTSRLFEVTQNA